MSDRQAEQSAAPEQGALPLDDNDSVNTQALVLLGNQLLAQAYRFTTVTPVTHQRVNARTGNEWARSLTDVFGWSRPFRMSGIDAPVSPEMVELMRAADILRPFEDGWKSVLRASTLDGKLYFHSAYPTTEADAIFFGPDTYRFIRALQSTLTSAFTTGATIHRAADIGCGAGPGALTIATHCPDAEVFAVDINDAALHVTAVNARLATLPNIAPCNSNLLTALPGQFDLIVSNPPYLVDHEQRTYRHGGGPLGAGLSLAIVDAALERLTPQGMLLMYTGAAIIDGEDPFLQALQSRLAGQRCAWSYEELDPDVFGEELDEVAYAQCDRIAAVWLKVRMTNTV